MASFLRACIFGCLVSLVLTQASDPCTGLVCETPGYECRLVVVSCAPDSPCPPQPKCVPRGQGLVGACRYGSPVLEQIGVQTYTTPYCNDQKLCPESTECNTEVQDIQSICCWNPNPGPQPVTKPPVTSNSLVNFNGHCAQAFPLPAFFCQFIVPPCKQNSDCLPGSLCCHTDKCGRLGCLLARFTRECSFLDRITGLCED